MKKKIAVFANGWNNDYLMLCLKGIQRGAKAHNVDLFLFIDYVAYTDKPDFVAGEINLLNLPDLQFFDGVLLIGNMLTVAGEIDILREQVLKYNIPAVSLNYDLEGVDSVLTDSISGMSELVTHLLEAHGARDILWLGGPRDNQDSIDRLNTLINVMQDHGLTLPEDHILFGDWSYYAAKRELLPWIKSHEKLPDVVVCANDNMALGACIFFEQMGIKVPEQVKVTGFDYLECGQDFYPAITTVERDVEERAYNGIMQLIRKLQGEACEHRLYYNTRLSVGESCGCKLSVEHQRKRLLAFQRDWIKSVDNSIFGWHVTTLDESMVWVKKRDELYEALKFIWEDSHVYEGNDFALCLDDRFVKSIDEEVELLTKGYSEQVQVIYSMKDGVAQPSMYMPTKQLVPHYEDNTPESHTYVIVPLHIADKCMGYMTIRDTLSMLVDASMMTWTKHLANGLERARQNILLEMLNECLNTLSRTDRLTGLLNREGYEKSAIPRLEECRKAGLSAAIVVVDIDHMKQINDQHGHLQGDVALITISDSIKTVLPDNWYAVRYGGDEFVLLGECESRQKAEQLKENILEQIRLKADGKLPYYLTASIGYMMVEPYTDLSIEEYFRGADQAMYMMKQRRHSAEQE